MSIFTEQGKSITGATEADSQFARDAKAGRQARKNQGLSQMFKQGFMTGEESLAGKLQAIEGQRRAEEVARAQQEVALQHMQNKLANGGAQGYAAYYNAAAGGIPLPEVDETGEPVYSLGDN